ncbi:MAG: DNA repair protein RadC [Anaerolineae bacterium]|nr:MAG: DNA repair protein RadC [Anaerolineae bacterium]
MIDTDLLAARVAEKLAPYLWNNAILDALYPEDEQYINSPNNVADLLQTENLEQENLFVICLNTKNRILSIERLYKGAVNSTTVRIAEIFRTAVRLNASSIVLAHNHPSGDPIPSPDDISTTKQIQQAGELLEITVLDHVVLGRGGRFYSMKSEGIF